MEQCWVSRIISQESGYSGKKEPRGIALHQKPPPTCPFIPPQSFSRRIAMRRVVVLSLFTALTLGLSSAGPQARAASPAHEGAGPIAPHFSDADKADLKRISA